MSTYERWAIEAGLAKNGGGGERSRQRAAGPGEREGSDISRGGSGVGQLKRHLGRSVLSDTIQDGSQKTGTKARRARFRKSPARQML